MKGGHAPAVIGKSQDFEPAGSSFRFDPDAFGAGVTAVLGQFAEKKPGIITRSKIYSHFSRRARRIAGYVEGDGSPVFTKDF